MNIGSRVWAIAEGYLPPLGPLPEDRARRSHEAAGILNTGAQPAQLRITI
jgi:hypothetical protein